MVKKITKSSIIGMYLNSYGRSYYLRELAAKLGKPHQTIKPYVDELVKDGILLKNKRKNITDYSLNIKDKRASPYIIISEKEKLIERLRDDAYMRILFEKISSFFNKNIFVVFGSAAEKTQKGSDIDLLVVGGNDVSKVLRDYEDVYNKKVHMVSIKGLSGLSIGLIKEIYKKHMILNNTEEVISFFEEAYGQNRLV